MFRYEPAIPYNATNGVPPSSGPRPGTVALMGVIVDAFPEVSSGGIYSPRRMNLASGPGRLWSKHAEGGAGDIMVRVDSFLFPEGDPVGWKIANRLVANFEELGIQQVIYARKIWTVSKRSSGWRNLSKKSLSHLDHIHFEMIRERANSLTAQRAASLLAVALKAPFTYQQFGQSGPWVAEARWWLGLPPSDRFDEAMLKAVKAAQERCGAVNDGIIGPITWGCLKQNPSAAVASLYRTVAGRDPDAEGHAYWTGLLRDDEVLMSGIAALLSAEAEQVTAPAQQAVSVPAAPSESVPLVVAPEPMSAEITDLEAVDQIRTALLDCLERH